MPAPARDLKMLKKAKIFWEMRSCSSHPKSHHNLLLNTYITLDFEN